MAACKKSITIEANVEIFFERVWVHLGYHKPSSQIKIDSSSTHSGRSSRYCWTPRSPNTLPSTSIWMAKSRSSTGLSCISYTCIIPRIPTPRMRFFPMSNTTTTEPYIAPLTIVPFRWGWDFKNWVPWMLYYPLRPPRKTHPMLKLKPTKLPSSLSASMSHTHYLNQNFH
jgi:hypothetical protein